MKHTSGKWEYDGHQNGYVSEMINGEEYENIIAEIPVPGLYNTSDNIMQQETNARLIAAAPELLEACKAVNEWLEKNVDVAGLKGIKGIADMSRLSGIVRKAIAAAEGNERG